MGCSSYPDKTFFILPKNEFTRKAWIAAINGKEGILPKNIYLCSDHFEGASFNKSRALQAQSLVISFVYLTYHLTNIRTKLCTFCIWPTQSQRNNFQTTLHKVLFYCNIIAIFCNILRYCNILYS